MNALFKNKLIIPLAIIIGVGSLAFWIVKDPTADFTTSTPGMDADQSDSGARSEEVNIGEYFEKQMTFESDLEEKWPWFRGPDADNIYKGSHKIANQWPDEGPTVVWEKEMGEGHAAPAIYDGMAYILDYDEEKKADALKCFSLETGKEIWKRWYGVHIKRNHGMSRTVPAVTEKYVLTIGPKCHVMCVDRISGEMLWGLDLVKTYGTEVPFWYTGQCPMIDKNMAIIAPGGSSLLIGIDCETGKVIWETPNEKKIKMSHSSIVKTKLAGKRMYVYVGVGGTIGVSAEEEDMGKILWENSDFPATVIAPSPVPIGNDKLFMTAGYGAGSIMYHIVKNASTYEAKTLSVLKPKDGLASEQQSPVFYKGHLFSTMPKDAGTMRNQFVCYHPDDITTPAWSSGQTERFGLGPYIVIDDKIIILNDDGTLTMIEANTEHYNQLARHRIVEGHDAWGPFAFADGYLLLRDVKHLICLNLNQ